jgi:trans-2,3-dihydro-3-hydroxyanthranilate isomerase
MMSKTLRYLHLDVFTDRPFEGNQLAVFPEPDGLTTGQMQTLAREMNFSESTFIFPAEAAADPGSRVRMRIFTPAEELPMAGHPTIGSTFALASLGAIGRGRTEFVFELGIGPTPVSLEWGADGLSFAWMTQLVPSYGGSVTDRAALAPALGIEPSDLPANLPAEVVSCGLPYLVVPIASRAAVDAVSIDRKAFVKCCRESGIEDRAVFLFTTERGDGPETVYSRMLAPGFGIAEDPATGSASGPLGCYLLRHGLVTEAAARSIVSLQGVAMRRPSRIHVDIESRNGAVSRVRVGGKSVIVGNGDLHL